MKRKFTFLIAAAVMLLTMVATTGEMWGQTRDVQELTNANIVAAGDPNGGYKDWTITDNNDNEWNAYAIKNKHSNATSAYHYLQIKKYASNTAYYIQLPELGTKITSITMTVSGSNQPMTGGGNNATLFFSNSNSTSSSGSGVVSGTGVSSVTIDCTSLNLNTGYITSSGAVRIWDISVSYTSGGGSTPSISADDVNIAYDATGGGIAYTINNPVEGGALGAEVTDGDWLSLGQGTASPIAFTCSANEASVARTATVRLTYTYNAKAIVTKDVTITQAAAPVIYTTIPQLFAAATSTETNVNVTFGDWVVSGVSGSSAYVTDNSGNGFIIYKSGHGFAVNNKLSGTVTGTPLKLYQGSAEFTNLTASTTGLTVNDDGEITIITNKTITDLGGVNTGAVITLSNLTYDGTNLSDGTNTIKPYNTLYSGMSFTNGKIYNVTGVYVQYGNTKEIAPRSAADIVEVTTPTLTTTNVNITSNATEGAITYTLENPTQDGVLTAEITAGNEGSWLTLGDLGANVPFTCTANTGDERTATVTLTYTYNTNETVTAASVVTQAAYAASVTVDPATVNAPYSGADGTLNVTYNNITDINAEVWFCNAEGTAAASYDWITAFINAQNNVEYLVENNDGDARTAYFKVYALDDQANDVYSNLVTVTQAALTYVVTFNVNGGTFVPNADFATVNEEKTAGTYNLPSATKAGWDFAGWSDGTTTYEANAEYTVSAAVAFTAQWTETTTGSIVFGNNGTNIDKASVTGNDSFGNTWTITTVGTSSFTQNANYSQVGSGNKPATSITFTTTLAQETTFTAFSAKFGGFSGTAGTVTLKVGEKTIGSGSLNEGSDVIVENTTSATGTVLTVTVTNIAKGVKCYYISYTISAGSDPMIVAQNSIELSSTDTYGEFDYSIVNPVPEVNLTASSTDEWISNINVTAEKVTFVTTPNTSTTDNREGTITLSYPNASNKNVTVTQSKVDYATMPFEFVGNEATIPTGVSTDAGAYNTSPYLKFDATGKYLVLKLVEAPVSISYDIKGNNFSGGTFKVQVSANGSSYTDIETYTVLGETQTITLLNSDDNVRYIKWVYTEKVNGNVALGNLNVTTELIINGDCTVDNITISNTEVLTIEAGSVMTITGTLTNEGGASNLIIEDGGQLIHNGNVTATLKKNVAGYNTRSVSGWYTIASPVANMDVNCATTGTYDFFAFNEENTKWLNQKVAANNITNFEQGVGYLYANADATVVNYLGTLIGTETEVTKPLSYACENASYQGINLMGNPFSRNLVAGNIEIASTPLTTYYTVEGGNELTAKTLASTPIKPGQGFMVQATASSQNLVFNPTSKDRSAAKVGYISIVAGNSEFTDNAFVQVGGGNTLHKMTLSDNSSIVYVMNNGNDYAAATIDALEGSMPVCFKANALGSYTITIEAIDINADYLHLIDNFTGEDINLLLEPSYSFIASNGDRAERFTLVFRSNGSEGTTNDIFAYQNNNDIVVNGEGELQVFDVTGRMVATQHVNGVQTVNVPSQGMFIFKLNEKTQKIVVR